MGLIKVLAKLLNKDVVAEELLKNVITSRLSSTKQFGIQQFGIHNHQQY